MLMLVKKKCDEWSFQCKYMFDCIPKSKLHDGTADCYDKSDEENQSMNWILLNN